MITFYFDDAVAKVWYDSSMKCLFMKVQRALTSSELDLLAKAVLGAIKKLKRDSDGALYLVSDLHFMRKLV